jgi:excinuclease UvrABC nuclease subunit
MSHCYKWSKSWIEFKAPSAQGVYSIRDKAGAVIFIGKGNIRQRLLSHWNRENSTDAVVWSFDPCFFSFELTDHAADREAELIVELKPTCRQIPHSKFPKFW